jgi:phenylacetic acid degradation operon negative regulatory protein
MTNAEVNPATHPRVAEFIAQGRGQARSLIVTVFGDALMPRGGRIWLGSLVTLLQGLGLNDRWVRTSVSRLVQDDWLETVTVGRRADYQLSASGRTRFEEAARQIYAPAPPAWDGQWRCLLNLGPAAATGEPPTQRDALRRALAWHGFGELGSVGFVHPGADLAAVVHELRQGPLAPTLKSLLPLLAHSSALPGAAHDRQLVARAWNLEALGRDYAGFVQRYEALSTQSTPPPAMAFHLRTLLIHDYRRLLLRDPELPQELLPAHWPGESARALCAQLYATWWMPSEAHLDATVCWADGHAPQRLVAGLRP